jgi:hypothetical protein
MVEARMPAALRATDTRGAEMGGALTTPTVVSARSQADACASPRP